MTPNNLTEHGLSKSTLALFAGLEFAEFMLAGYIVYRANGKL